MKPLVSILIPAYNAEKFIEQTLHSAVSQTWERKEIIIVDDGSTDQTLNIARRFESPSVRLFSQKNQGAAAARNKAFSLCQGDYIQWLDADDLLAPDKIALQMRVLETCASRRTLVSGEWGRFLYRPYCAKFVPTALWCDLTPVEWLVRKMGQNLFLQTATWLVSRELTESAGPWNTMLLGDDDGEYFCRVILKSNIIRFVPDSKVYYRDVGRGSLSYIGNSDRKIEAQLRSMRLHIQYLRSLEDSDRVRAACITYIQNWLVNFSPERLDLVAELRQMAVDLGGNLKPLRLPWKYRWIKAAFGPSLAYRAQLTMPRVRWSVQRAFSKALLQIQGRHISHNLAERSSRPRRNVLTAVKSLF